MAAIPPFQRDMESKGVPGLVPAENLSRARGDVCSLMTFHSITGQGWLTLAGIKRLRSFARQSREHDTVYLFSEH
jgi:hypothetical protein